MGTNVEWKARARNPEHQHELARQLAEADPELLEQTDTFFRLPRGRLKLRRLGPDAGELIFYQRPDQTGPRQSSYSIAPTNQPEALKDTLAQALGVVGQVRKRRWLYLTGQSRIHLDEVDGLGNFIEVEVVLQPGQTVIEGERIAEDLRRALKVSEQDLVREAYVDLLLDRR
jgi:adenylate cyclase class IV